MNRHWFSIAAVGIVSTIAATGLASDHQDSPSGSTDTTADISDLFAFASPEKPGHLVVAMNVDPAAFSNAKFSDAVTYSIRLRPEYTSINRELRIDCSFDLVAGSTDQIATCTGYKFDPANGRVYGRFGGKPTPVNQSTDGKDGLRIFTGLRADPFGIDAAGSGPPIRGQGWQYTTGKNALAGLDVQSIVVEIDVVKLLGTTASAKKIKLAAETTMRVKS